MNIANSLLELKEESPEQLLRRVNRFLPSIVSGVLIIAIAYRLAVLTWIAVPSAPRSAPPPLAAGGVASSAVPVDDPSYEILLGSHLFGEPPDQSQPVVVQQVVDAPDTSLNLVLTGVNARGRPDEGEAFISSGRSEQKVYFVGDTIDGGNGASLHSIYPDRVLLSRSGRLETLRLPQDDNNSRPAVRSPRFVAPQANNNNNTSLREAISDNATLLSDIVTPMLERDGDQVLGFRLRPGRNRDAFEALGFLDGDVLTDVNGMPMNDTQSAMRVFQALEEAQLANVTILRDGAPLVLAIDISQIEDLVEDHQ